VKIPYDPVSRIAPRCDGSVRVIRIRVRIADFVEKNTVLQIPTAS